MRLMVLILPLATALQLGSRGWTTPRVRPVASAPAAEAELLSLLEASGQEDRGKDLSAQELASVHRLAVELESGAAADQDTNDSPLLPGRWRVLYQGKPGHHDVLLFRRVLAELPVWRRAVADPEPRLRLEHRIAPVSGRRD